MNRRNFILASSALTAVALSGSVAWTRRWKYIVVHHSAGNFGTIDFLQKVHRERQPNDPVDAIPYHYVIGNGNGLAMGEIASDWRHEWGIWGAHVSGNNSWVNFRGLGICLIGNYEENPMPPQQFDALVVLTKKLMSQHRISPDNVYGHGKINGESTKCPGRHFPMEEFKVAIT